MKRYLPVSLFLLFIILALLTVLTAIVQFKKTMAQAGMVEINLENSKTISIPEGIVAVPCEQITVPADVDNAADIAAMDLEIAFDPNILQLVDKDMENSMKFRIEAIGNTTAKKVTSCTFYVATDGSDSSGDGSIGNPWATIQKAADNVSAGDTVMIREGIYRPNPNIFIPASGTSGNKITFRAYPGETVIIDGENCYNSPGPDGRGFHGIITIQGKDYIRLENLTFRNNDYGWCVLIEHKIADSTDPASHIELVNLDCSNTPVSEGIQIRGHSTNIVIDNCKVHDIRSGLSGIDIYMWGSNKGTPSGEDPGRPSYIEVKNCHVYNIFGGSPGAGIGSEQADNLHVHNNTTHNCSIGLDIGSGDNNDVHHNTIYNCANGGIYISSNEDSIIYNNEIYNINNEYALCAYYWIANGEAHARNRFYNNIIHDSKGAIWSSDEKKIGISGSGPASDMMYYNNLIYNIGTRVATILINGVDRLEFYNNTIISGKMNSCDVIRLQYDADNAVFYNNIISMEGSKEVFSIQPGCNDYNIDYNCYFDRTEVMTGQPGKNSLQDKDPEFTDTATHDYSLKSTSVCRDAATDLSARFTTDIKGKTRSAWDMGAYEY
ncbi:MAG: right-handed parallel beta-helix repeat-containing protein [bacterium]